MKIWQNSEASFKLKMFQRPYALERREWMFEKRSDVAEMEKLPWIKLGTDKDLFV